MKQTKNKAPIISVITPSYNSANCIEKAIKSVMEQDYTNWEHIVVDGGSSDDTVKLLKKYSHIKWISEPDNGQADAMNKGFSMSSGDVIVYLNSDDYFYPKAFSTVIEAFNEGASFVVGNVKVKSPRQNSEFINRPRISHYGMLRHWEPNAFCHNPVGYFYIREVQEKCPFNSNNYSTMDLEFLLDAACKYKFTKINRILGCFEDTADTKTGTTQSQLNYWQIGTFPYIERHISLYDDETRLKYHDDRRQGYKQLQRHMNRVTNAKTKIKSSTIDKNKVSFILPTYNSEDTIQRAIDSVFNQGLSNFELIIIDDCSSDDTGKIIHGQYGNHPKIKFYRNSENSKLGASRNAGVSHSSGDYVFFLDSDDWLEPQSVPLLLKIATSTNADIVAGGVNKCFAQKESITLIDEEFVTPGGSEALFYFANHSIGSVVWNKLYRTSLLKNNNIQFPAPHWHEDIMFTAQALSKCNIYLSVSDPCYNYFHRDQSVSNSNPSLFHIASYLRVYHDLQLIIETERLLESYEGRKLAERLLKSHFYDQFVPRIAKVILANRNINISDVIEHHITTLFGKNSFYIANGVSNIFEVLRATPDLEAAPSTYNQGEIQSLTEQLRIANNSITRMQNTKLWQFAEVLRAVTSPLRKLV